MIIQIALGIILGVSILVGLIFLIPWLFRNRDEVGDWFAVIVGIIFIYILWKHFDLVKTILTSL